MDEAELNAELENPYKCKLTLVTSRGKSHVLDRIVSSVTGWVDPSHQIIAIEERIGPEKNKKPLKVKSKHGCLVTPAVSLMLFMKETGHPCALDIEKVLKKGPWTFHHKVELQCKNTPNTSLAKQEFYKLADDLPLFVVCPVLLDDEHLRINMYVRNFSAMVEFYRLVTETEIETNKPEFCIFQIYRQPGLDIQLSLKRSQYIYPIPLESSYVSFNIKSIETIRLNCQVMHVNGNVYSTRDPDGNFVVLYETPGLDQNRECPEHGFLNACGCLKGQEESSRCLGNSMNTDDLKSLKSMTESHDSGRYSDIDGHEDLKRSTVINQMQRDFTLVSEISEGYASSEVSTDTFVSPGSTVLDRGKKTVNGKDVLKKSIKNSNVNSIKSGTDLSSFSKKNNVVPVFL